MPIGNALPANAFRVAVANLQPAAAPMLAPSSVYSVALAPGSGWFGSGFPAGTYFYRVTAGNASGLSMASAEVSATVLVNGAVLLTWLPVAGATYYLVHRGTTSGGQSQYWQVVPGVQSGPGTVTASAGTATFSTSQSGVVVEGAIITVAGVDYYIKAFNGTTGGVLSGAPTFGASAFQIKQTTSLTDVGGGFSGTITPPTFTPLGLMNTSDVSEQENTAGFDIFDSDDPITLQGKPRRTLTLSGYLGDADSGQLLVLAAADLKRPVVLRYLWDGTNGFVAECNVNAYKGGAKAGNQPTDLSLDFVAVRGSGQLIGTGPLL